MGVLTTRLHGSITAIAAMATAAASTDLPDMSCLKAFCNATGQGLFLSSVYASVAYSPFDFDYPFPSSVYPPISVSLPASTCSTVRPLHMLPILHTLPPSVGVPTPQCFASPSNSIQFHRAASHPPRCTDVAFCSPHSGTCHIGLSEKSSHRLPTILSRCSLSHCECHPLLPLNLYSRSKNVSSLLPLPEGCKRHSLWRYPDPVVFYQSHVFPAKSLYGQTAYPGLSQASRFERLISSLFSAYACPIVSSAKLLHTWHTPSVDSNPLQPDSGEKQSGKRKPTVTVVLLGWLGAQQKHLKTYAEWYTSRGIHAVTFVVPMKDLLTIKAGDIAEKHVDMLTEQLTQCLTEDNKQGNEKIVIFHTFSNTGWLIYGAVLERLIHQGDGFLGKIKGCVVDSAPSARPDPQVWASGFSAALLKKNSVATQKLYFDAASPNNKLNTRPQPTLKESALLAMLEKFFSVFLQLPYVNRRLNDVISILSNQQPPCPQLYIYSTADTVIPAESVEAFIEEQIKAGRTVSACNFWCSPHVDHFRTYPEKYSDQLTSFLKLCIPQWSSQ